MNLLPIHLQKDLIIRYRMRIVRGLLFVATVFSVIAIGVSGMLYGIVSEEHSSWKSYVDAINTNPDTVRAAEARESLKNIESTIALLTPSEDTLSVVPFFLEIVERREGVIVLGMNVEENPSKKEYVATIRGEAQDRASLVAFARALEAAGFDDVDVPVGSLVNESDIAFSFSFTL
jgi:hypothetical protein